MNDTNNWEPAIQAWSQLLGSDGVITAGEALTRYTKGTTPTKREVPVALLPRTREEVAEVVKIAQQFGTPIYPLSGGNNWGYGDARPVVSPCAVLDLRQLNRILDFDPELGVVTVEPGVTQMDLWKYLDSNNLPYLVPITGAGPLGSLLGNALERGYGLSPICDHFGALMAMEVVLPTGELYRSALTEMGGETIDKAYKWGLGPYLDGIFTQSAFGVVTNVSIALAPRPPAMEAFFFWIDRDEQFEPAVEASAQMLKLLGPTLASIKLINSLTMFSYSFPYPFEHVAPGEVLTPDIVAELAKKSTVSEWVGSGCLYGPPEVIGAAMKIIKRLLRGKAGRLVFLKPARVRTLTRIAHALPRSLAGPLVLLSEKMSSGIDLMAGKPNEMALPLAYWKSRSIALPKTRLDPARDGCGLLWYPPIVPIKPQAARKFVTMVREVMPSYGMDPLITLTSLSERVFDCTVPLLFDSSNPTEVERAHACYRALFEAGRTEGFLPYRLGIEGMAHAIDPDSAYWQLVSRLKSALDPNRILAPGRYEPGFRS